MMNKELAIHHLLKMYNRKPDDRTVMNYMEVCRDYENEDVISAVKLLIGLSEALPYPRTLATTLARQFNSKDKKRRCEDCENKGYREDNREHDMNGLENFSRGAVTRCHCGAGVHANNVNFTPKEQVRVGAYAAILAGDIAIRAVDGEVITSPEHWAKYVWTKENFEAFCRLVKDMTMMDLVLAKQVIEEVDAIDCQTIPLEVATDVKNRVKLMPKESMFNAIER